MIDWIKDRLVERTSLDGAALIGVGIVIILFGAVSYTHLTLPTILLV